MGVVVVGSDAFASSPSGVNGVVGDEWQLVATDSGAGDAGPDRRSGALFGNGKILSQPCRSRLPPEATTLVHDLSVSARHLVYRERPCQDPTQGRRDESIAGRRFLYRKTQTRAVSHRMGPGAHGGKQRQRSGKAGGSAESSGLGSA